MQKPIEGIGPLAEKPADQHMDYALTVVDQKGVVCSACGRLHN
jgi:hypothetical protein